MAIENAQLTTGDLDVLIVPAGETWAITSIMVANTYSPNDPSPETHDASFDMHFRKDQQARDNKVTCVVRELNLPAGETFTFDTEKIVLTEGCKVTFVAQPDIGSSLTDLSVSISYLRVD